MKTTAKQIVQSLVGLQMHYVMICKNSFGSKFQFILYLKETWKSNNYQILEFHLIIPNCIVKRFILFNISEDELRESKLALHVIFSALNRSLFFTASTNFKRIIRSVAFSRKHKKSSGDKRWDLPLSILCLW